jgi:ABC-type nickel/cobalt efflux system permease component RcnA
VKSVYEVNVAGAAPAGACTRGNPRGSPFANPGHGKTLLASYLVGSRGTDRHAILLGGMVTFTHTASVIAMGLLALLAGQLIVPSLLLPTLELGSGLLVILLGTRLARDRSQSLRNELDGLLTRYFTTGPQGYTQAWNSHEWDTADS